MNVAHAVRHVAEFDRTDAGVGFIVAMETALREDLDLHAGGIAKHDGLGDRGGQVAPPLVFHVLTMQRRRKLAKVAVGRNLERDPAEMRGGAPLESDRFLPELGGEKNSVGRAVDDLQPDDARPVIGLLVDVRRYQIGVAEPMYFDHDALP